MWLSKHKYNLLFIGHAFVLTLVIVMQGINITNEGQKFIGEAKMILGSDSESIVKYQLLNLSYIIYLIPFLALGIPLKAIVLFTHMITLFSYWKFSSFLKERYNETVAFMWLAFMMHCPLLVYWNFSLYSESFFIALSLLFVSSIFKNERIGFFYAFVLVFTRPTGILIGLACWLLKLICNEKISLKRSLLYLAPILLVLFSIIFFFVELHTNGVAREIMSGSVICGLPTHPMSKYLPLHFTLGKAYVYYIGQYGFGDLLGVMVRRGISFFNLTRPHYSLFHNLVNACFSIFFVLNLLCFIGTFKKLKKYFLEVFYIQVIVLLNCALVILFFNEWTERYTVVTFPFLFVSSAIYLDHLINARRVAV